MYKTDEVSGGLDTFPPSEKWHLPFERTSVQSERAINKTSGKYRPFGMKVFNNRLWVLNEGYKGENSDSLNEAVWVGYID